MREEQITTITLYKYLSACAVEKFVKDKTIKLSFGYEANDRFEMLRGDLFPRNSRAEQEVEFESGTRIGFISLTAVEENPYMWGYYSEKYMGARLKLRFKVKRVKVGKKGFRYLRADAPPPLQKELVSIENSRFDGEYIEKCEYEVNRIDKINTSLKKCTKNIISNKHTSWEGEQEYRILYSVNCLGGHALSPLLIELPGGIYTTADLNRNVVALELGPFCSLMISDIKRELVKDELLRGTVVRRVRFAPGLYKTVYDRETSSYEGYITNSSRLSKYIEHFQKAEIRPIAECNWNSFMCAARRGEAEDLKQLYLDKTSVKNMDLFGHNALFLAVQARSETCVRFLIDKEATLNNSSKNEKGDALLWASSIGYDEFVIKLLQWGANVKFEDKNKRTALHWAARNGHDQCVKIIIEHINSHREKLFEVLEKKDSEGRTPLMLAAWGKNYLAVMYLIKAGANVNATDNDNSTALIMAAWGDSKNDYNDSQIVELLLFHGANPSIREFSGYSALSYAAGNGRHDCLRLLLHAEFQWPQTRGFEVETHAEGYQQDTSQSHQYTETLNLLVFAISSGVPSCVHLILEHIHFFLDREERVKALPLHRDMISIAMLGSSAPLGDYDSIIKILSKYELISTNSEKLANLCHSHHDVLMKMARYGRIHLIENMLKEDRKLADIRDEGGCSVLMWIVADEQNIIKNYEGSFDYREDIDRTLEEIMETVDRASIMLTDTCGCNVIMWAARKGSNRCLRALLKFLSKEEIEAALSAQDKNGMTALMWAAWKQNKTCMEILFENKACDVTIQDDQGNTALDWAVKGGSEKCVHFLLEQGAKFGIPDWEND